MHNIDILRHTIQNLTLRSLGAIRSQERFKSGNRVSDLFTNTVAQLPAHTQIDPVQDWEIGSPTYGQFFFVAGYDDAGATHTPLGG